MLTIKVNVNDRAIVRDIIEALRPFIGSEESLKLTLLSKRAEGSTLHKVFFCPNRKKLVKATTLTSDI